MSEVDAWETLANQNAWMLVDYKRGKSIHAYVVRINGAIISDRGKVSIETEIGKIERGGGTWVGLGRYCCIPLANILWREIVREIQVDEVSLFRPHESRVVAMKSRFN